MEELLVTPGEIAMIYSYTSIPGKGKESINLVKKSIKILEDNGIEPPDPKEVEFSSFKEKNGWGNSFDGSELSVILK